MYRRIMGFFGGAMSESSEENQGLTRERNNEDSANSGASIMAAGEQGAVLRERVQNLEKELKDRIDEIGGYKSRLQSVENELTVLKQMAISSPAKTISTGVGDNDVNARSNTTGKEPSADPRTQDAGQLTNENSELRDALGKTSQLLKDKTDLCDNQERQNLALTNQIASLKEVVSITKDLLNIRNMEVKHLQSDVESMEGKIADERDRHNIMIVKMDEAVKLNSDLKKEYETQLKIFQDLRNKYEEKVAFLIKENQKLEGQISMSKTTVPIELEEQPTINDSNALE